MNSTTEHKCNIFLCKNTVEKRRFRYPGKKHFNAVLVFFCRATMFSLGIVLWLVDGRFEDTNVREISVALRVVETITDDEAVGNLEARVVYCDGFDTFTSLIQQGADAQAEGAALA